MENVPKLQPIKQPIRSRKNLKFLARNQWENYPWSKPSRDIKKRELCRTSSVGMQWIQRFNDRDYPILKFSAQCSLNKYLRCNPCHWIPLYFRHFSHFKLMDFSKMTWKEVSIYRWDIRKRGSPPCLIPTLISSSPTLILSQWEPENCVIWIINKINDLWFLIKIFLKSGQINIARNNEERHSFRSFLVFIY